MFADNTRMWERFAPLVARAEKPSRYLGQEWGSVEASSKPDADYHAVLIYPDVYEVGQANQAIAILYDDMNRDPRILCERAYLPWVDLSAKMRANGLPLCSLETYTPLSEFDFVGITLPHELAYANVLELLDLARIPLHAAERGEDDPLVFAGGPCAFNPEPLAPFLDAVFVGEGEGLDREVALMHRELRAAGATRAEVLRELAKVSGVYVPSLYRIEWHRAEVLQAAGGCGEPGAVGGEGDDAASPEDVQPSADSPVGARPHASAQVTEGCEGRGTDGHPTGDAAGSEDAQPGAGSPAQVAAGCEPPCVDGSAYAVAVPLASGVPDVVEKRIVQDFDSIDALPRPVVPFSELVHDRLAIEVLRGCNRGCRFCQAGMIYRPVRERDADDVIAAVARGMACTGYDEVSLTSLSSTDHSTIEEQLRRLNRRFAGTGVGVSLPSQRVDAFGVELARLAAGEKKGGLTLAPEAGTQRLRDCINKGVTEDDIFTAVESAFSMGWRRLKLYFMIGLPGETDDDVRGIGGLCRRVYAAAKDAVPDDQRGNVRMSASVALFVPKPATPFQWDGQIPLAEIERRIGLLKESFPKKGVDLHWHDSATSYVEAVLARGGRECAALVEGAWRNGARFDAWTEQFDFSAWQRAGDACGVPVLQAATREYAEGGPLPWGHIGSGVREEFLRRERAKARRGETTPDCSFGPCSACGVCQDLRGANGERVRNRTEKPRVASATERKRAEGGASTDAQASGPLQDHAEDGDSGRRGAALPARSGAETSSDHEGGAL